MLYTPLRGHWLLHRTVVTAYRDRYRKTVDVETEDVGLWMFWWML